MKLGVSDIKGCVGIFPTPATADADKWTVRNSVNLDEVARMVPLVHQPGINILMTTGTFGEGASLLHQELLDFVDCLVQTNRRKAALFVGVTTLNTRETVARGRDILDKFDVDGLFLGRPMWLPLDDEGVIAYYRDMAEAFKGVPLIVYDNPLAFKGKISPDVYRQLAQIPEIVAAKHTGGPKLIEDLKAVGDNIRLLPIETAWPEPAQDYPDQLLAGWSGNIACCPAAASALALAVERRDWARALHIAGRVEWATEPMFPGGNFERFMQYSIQIAHERFRGAGLIDPGPSRPPYAHAPADIRAGGFEAGRRLGVLQKEFDEGA